MGLVQRQTIKNNIIAVVAVVVGAVAQLKLYSLDLELRGFIDGMLKLAFLIGPFVGFGAHIVMVRFLPYLKTDKVEASQQLLTRALALVTVNLVVLSLLNWLVGDQVVQFFVDRGYSLGLLQTHRWEAIFLLAPVNYSIILTSHILNFQRIVLPAVFNNLLVKLGLPVVFALAIWNYIANSWVMYGVIALYTLVTVCLCLVAFSMGIFKLRWGKLKLEGARQRDLFTMGMFTLFNGVGAAMATHLDTVSVNTILGNTPTGIYGFAVFVVGMMLIPYRAINQICAPLVAKAWKEKDRDYLNGLYQQSSTALFSVGMVIFVGCLICLPVVYQLSDKINQYAVGYYAAIILGAGQLINLLTSINDLLISYTDNFRWGGLFVVILGGLNLALNYYFIGILGWGLEGAAFATLVSLSIYNLCKGIFIYHRMGIQPFSIESLFVAMGGGVIAFLAYLVPDIGNVYVDLFLKGGIVVALFYGYFRFTNLVPVMHKAIKDGVKGVFG